MMDPKPLLLIVDDDASTQAALTRLLHSHYQVKSASSAEEALKLIEQKEKVALILADYHLPGLSGLDFFRRCQTLSPPSIRILLSGQLDLQPLSEAINDGLIHRVFLKPWENHLLLFHLQECLQQQQLLEKKQQLETMALTDSVTGLYNHRFFQERIRVELERAKRHSRPLSLVMIDLDQFKETNDKKGHLEGDRVLKQLAWHLTRSLRAVDFVCRYGGDEFVLILPDTQIEDAFDVCERIRRDFELEKQGSSHLTISLGVAFYPNHGEDAPTLIDSADKALLQAKSQGRNQTVIASP